MRDILLVMAILIGLGVTLRYPFAGLLIWEWLSLMQPHEDVWGFSRSLPLNFIVAVVTIGSWLLSKEPKKIPPHPIIYLLLTFLGWMTFNSFFAFDPAWSWPYWDQTWKIFFLGILISAMATNQIRVEAIIWTAAISILYYGIKGGVFTILTGGNFKVFGPDNSIIGDNNQLALALLMIMPLLEHLRTNAQSRILSLGLLASEILTAASILGSYSRGAYVAMAALAIFALMKAKRKFIFIIAIALVLVPAYYMMPQAFFDRVNTINEVGTDASFQGRVMAWQVAFRYAVDHFPLGAGFYAPQLQGIFNAYYPNETPHAAHSIYFQVLGEHGFIGLALYLAIAVSSLFICAKIAAPNPAMPADIQKLGKMIQLSLIAFYVGGAALSMAYYDLFIILLCLLPRLHHQALEFLPDRGRFRAKGHSYKLSQADNAAPN
jgi:putative inorganic carbon (HCO3(-)) transporter